MTIGILTHYTVINQGAILQMLALQKWLKQRGHTVYILRYTKDFDFAPQEAGKYNLSLRYVPFYLKEYVVKRGTGLAFFHVKKQMLYKKFISESFLFKDYALDTMDAVIVGSDEVFSLAFGCNMMMYGHGVRTDRLIAYAPSFGQTGIDRIRECCCQELIASGLKMFKALSVRDEPSAKTVNTLIGSPPRIVCDPVMLYDFSKEHADISRFHLENRKYLLLYSMDRWMVEKTEIDAIRAYARARGLLTVSAGTYHGWCDRNIVCNPVEWLEVFRAAAEVITDTFHGALLGILTNKKTVFHIRPLNRNKVSDLLDKVGMSDRVAPILTREYIEKIQSVETNYVMVNKKVDALREQSRKYLEDALDTRK